MPEPETQIVAERLPETHIPAGASGPPATISQAISQEMVLTAKTPSSCSSDRDPFAVPFHPDATTEEGTTGLPDHDDRDSSLHDPGDPDLRDLGMMDLVDLFMAKKKQQKVEAVGAILRRMGSLSWGDSKAREELCDWDGPSVRLANNSPPLK